MSLVYLTGREYSEPSIFPVWDYLKLPGTTEWQGAPPETQCATVKQRGRTTFVGGVSDGEVGLACMDFVQNDFYGKTRPAGAPGGVSARKAWFFIGEAGFVALGANITARTSAAAASAEAMEVTTTANQCLLDGDVTVASPAAPGGVKVPSGRHELANVSWVRHAGVTYMSLPTTPSAPEGAASVIVSNQAQVGAWSRLSTSQANTTETRDVFALQYRHGPSPAGQSYAYAVLPDPPALEATASGAPAEEVESAASRAMHVRDAISVAANSASAQAVAVAGMLQAVVYAVPPDGSGTNVDGGTGFNLTGVSAPCAVMVRAMSPPDAVTSAVEFTAADPSNHQGGATITFVIDRSLKSAAAGATLQDQAVSCEAAVMGKSRVTIALPPGISAGSSVSGRCAPSA